MIIEDSSNTHKNINVLHYKKYKHILKHANTAFVHENQSCLLMLYLK